MNKALPVSTNTKTSDIILQILEGKQHNIKMFGYSLAGNMDLDQNSYPDLAVGSLSDTVFIYRCWQLPFHVKVVTWRFVRCYSNIPLVCRSKTVISIKKDIKVTPKEIDLMKKTCGNSIWWDTDKRRTLKASLIDVLDILNSFEKIINEKIIVFLYSLTVEACFSYRANPPTYNPKISESVYAYHEKLSLFITVFCYLV